MNLIVRQVLELLLIVALFHVSKSSGTTNGLLGMMVGLCLGYSVYLGLQSGDSSMFK